MLHQYKSNENNSKNKYLQTPEQLHALFMSKQGKYKIEIDSWPIDAGTELKLKTPRGLINLNMLTPAQYNAFMNCFWENGLPLMGEGSISTAVREELGQLFLTETGEALDSVPTFLQIAKVRQLVIEKNKCVVS